MNRGTLIAGLLGGALLLFSTHGTAQQAGGESPTADPLTHSLGSMVDPQVYFNLMSQVMTNPAGIMLNPFSTCAQCHSAEDMDRYNTMMWPMLQMMNPSNWMSPQAYTRMMAAPMDPATYTKWYEGWMQKYGAMLGQGGQPATQ